MNLNTLVISDPYNLRPDICLNIGDTINISQKDIRIPIKSLEICETMGEIIVNMNRKERTVLVDHRGTVTLLGEKEEKVTLFPAPIPLSE